MDLVDRDILLRGAGLHQEYRSPVLFEGVSTGQSQECLCDHNMCRRRIHYCIRLRHHLPLLAYRVWVGELEAGFRRQLLRFQGFRLGSRLYQHRTRRLDPGHTASHVSGAATWNAEEGQFDHHVQCRHLVSNPPPLFLLYDLKLTC